jgi:hypothetical protein
VNASEHLLVDAGHVSAAVQSSWAAAHATVITPSIGMTVPQVEAFAAAILGRPVVGLGSEASINSVHGFLCGGGPAGLVMRGAFKVLAPRSVLS